MTALEIILIILIILFVGGIVAWRVLAHVRAKKGKVGARCGCGCSGCAASASCPSARAAKSDDYNDDMPEISVQSEVTCDFSDIIAKMQGSAENRSK